MFHISTVSLLVVFGKQVSSSTTNVIVDQDILHNAYLNMNDFENSTSSIIFTLISWLPIITSHSYYL